VQGASRYEPQALARRRPLARTQTALRLSLATERLTRLAGQLPSATLGIA